MSEARILGRRVFRLLSVLLKLLLHRIKCAVFDDQRFFVAHTPESMKIESDGICYPTCPSRRAYPL